MQGGHFCAEELHVYNGADNVYNFSFRHNCFSVSDL